MPTFAGVYVREPDDFLTVTTEADLIQLLDDPKAPVVDEDVLSWADLDPAQEEALLSTLDPVIVKKEGIVNGYVRAGGYIVPANDAIVVEISVQLVWNDLLVRKDRISREEWKTTNDTLMRQLRDISHGDTLLETPNAVEVDAPKLLVGGWGGTPRRYSGPGPGDV